MSDHVFYMSCHLLLSFETQELAKMSSLLTKMVVQDLLVDLEILVSPSNLSGSELHASLWHQFFGHPTGCFGHGVSLS